MAASVNFMVTALTTAGHRRLQESAPEGGLLTRVRHTPPGKGYAGFLAGIESVDLGHNGKRTILAPEGNCLQRPRVPLLACIDALAHMLPWAMALSPAWVIEPDWVC